MKGMMSYIKWIFVAAIAYIVYDVLIRRKNVSDDFSDYVNVQNGSYPDYRYEEWCDIIYIAGRGLGTYVNDILGVMHKLKTTADVKKLKETWGKKSNNSTWSFLGLIYPDITLAGYLAEEGVTEQCNKILKAKGIKELF